MHIVLMHFHLKTGGVTTVVKQQAAALSAAGHDVLLVTGGPVDAGMPAPVIDVPGLGYDEMATGSISADHCAAEIIERIGSHWTGRPPDVLHVHNPTLAKNRRLQSVLRTLHAKGIRLLCQIHDFAEDGRPDVYFREPYVADCHYAVLNHRDLALLNRAGLRSQGLHYLPNAVAPLPVTAPIPPAANAPLLYPVRAIRRKNIGEAILLALYVRPPGQLMITLPPNSPRDVGAYDAWKKLVKSRDLSVVFEAGLRHDFQKLVDDCRYVLTTSITEGFGFTFLEPWTAGKALWGRLLPDISRDFEKRNIRLSHLYTRLLIPVTWLDHHLLRKKWCRALRNAHERFDLAATKNDIESGWERIARDGLIDFGLLSEPFQQAVIEKVLADTDAFATLARINPFLKAPGPPEERETLITHNKAMVQQGFAPQQYGRRLLDIYTKVTAHSVQHAIDKRTLINFFLTPERFSMLKWSCYEG